MAEERKGTTTTVLAVSTVVSIMVGAASLLGFIQSSERRTTIMEVKIEQLGKQIDRMELILRDREHNEKGGKQK